MSSGSFFLLESVPPVNLFTTQTIRAITAPQKSIIKITPNPIHQPIPALQSHICNILYTSRHLLMWGKYLNLIIIPTP
jgi:hypothetical protein